jgi:hypothetical protein
MVQREAASYVHFLTELGPLTHGLIFLTRFY